MGPLASRSRHPGTRREAASRGSRSSGSPGVQVLKSESPSAVVQLVEWGSSKHEPPSLDDPRACPIPYEGAYRMRGRWLTPRYARLRNAAWAARNGRVASHQNPLALRLVLAEAERLVGEGEPLWDVLEAFAELLMRP